MITLITCPSCATNFKMDSSLIPPNGRMVRCSACQFKWRQMPRFASTGTRPSKTIDDLSFDEREERKKLVLPFMVVSTLFLLFALLLFFFKDPILNHFPQTEKFYSFFGVEMKQKGISLISPFLEEDKDAEGNKVILVQGTLINTDATKTLPIPPIRVTLRDKTNNIIQEFFIDEFSQKELAVGAIEDFTFKISPVPKNALDVGIEIFYE